MALATWWASFFLTLHIEYLSFIVFSLICYLPNTFIFTIIKLAQSVNGISSHDEEEINELQEDDRELFSDQLSSIGMLGRVAADHCIPLLTRWAHNSNLFKVKGQSRECKNSRMMSRRMFKLTPLMSLRKIFESQRPWPQVKILWTWWFENIS